MLTILYVTNSSDLYGSNQSLDYMIRSVAQEICPIVLFPHDGPAVQLFRNNGIECLVYPYLTVFSKPFRSLIKDAFLHPWRMRLTKQLRYDFRTAFYLRKKFRGRKVDVVHTNNSAISFGRMLSFALNAKHVWHIREQMHYGAHQVVYGGLPHLKRMMDKADARVFVSDSCKQWWGLKEMRSFVLFDAVRSLEDCCYEPQKQPYLLFCSGYITKGKGIERSIRAYGLSGLSRKGIGFKIAGEWPDEELVAEVVSIAKSYGCDNAVEFLPFQKDVKPLFSKAMGFINPSENEGMGRTTVEAMFYGCPVVGFASGGTLDLIKHGETGYLFHTIEECAELMNWVCSENQEKIILEAQECVKRNMSVEGYGRKIMEVYRSVLEE